MLMGMATDIPNGFCPAVSLHTTHCLSPASNGDVDTTDTDASNYRQDDFLTPQTNEVSHLSQENGHHTGTPRTPLVRNSIQPQLSQYIANEALHSSMVLTDQHRCDHLHLDSKHVSKSYNSPPSRSPRSIPHPSSNILSGIHIAATTSPDLSAGRIPMSTLSPGSDAALFSWHTHDEQQSLRGSRYAVKSNVKKKRVTIAGVDGSKYSLSGKRIGRPRVDRCNTRCHECDTVATPQWRFLTHEELLSCPIPLRLPSASTAGSADYGSEDGDGGVHEGIGTTKTGMTRKICLCNACWLRVHKAKQKLKNGGRVNFSTRRRSTSNIWHQQSSSPSGPSTRLSSVLEELAAKNVVLNEDNLTFRRHSFQSSQRLPSSSGSDPLATQNDVMVDASCAAASVIEAAAALALRNNSGEVLSTETVWLAPGLRYGGTVQGQPIILMNGQEFLLLPSVHATASSEQRTHLQQAQQRIEQHILQHVRDQIRKAQNEELPLQDIRQLQQSRDESSHFQPHGQQTAELANQLQRASLQQHLHPRQQFMDLLESSSTSSPPLDPIFRSSSSPSDRNQINEHAVTEQRQQQLNRQRRESLVSLTTAAQEFLSASAVPSGSTAMAPSLRTNTSLMAQLSALTLSPVLGDSADVNRVCQNGNSPLQNDLGALLPTTSNVVPKWQSPTMTATKNQTQIAGESTLSAMSEIAVQKLAGGQIDSVRKTNGVETKSGGFSDAQVTQNIPEEILLKHLQQTGNNDEVQNSDVSNSYSDIPTPNMRPNGSFFGPSGSLDIADNNTLRDANLLRPMLTNHWLFY